MSRLEESWNDVGDQFKKLGARLKEHYDERGVDEALDVSEESLDEALQSLGDGIQAAVGAVGDSITDPELKDDVRDAAGSLFTALGATFSEIGTQIAAPHDAPEGEAGAAEDAPADPDDDDATEASAPTVDASEDTPEADDT